MFRMMPIENALLGDYQTDADTGNFSAMVNELWRQDPTDRTYNEILNNTK